MYVDKDSHATHAFIYRYFYRQRVHFDYRELGASDRALFIRNLCADYAELLARKGCLLLNLVKELVKSAIGL